MADNYIENKMEEFRKMSGIPHRASPRREPSRSNQLSWRFPARRVLIISSEEKALEIAGAYRQKGCKTAIMAIDGSANHPEEKETRERKAAGNRELRKERAEEDFREMYRSWLGLDILIAGDEPESQTLSRLIENEWIRAMQELPDATFYTPRILTITEKGIEMRLLKEGNRNRPRQIIDSLLYMSREESAGIETQIAE